MGVTGASGSRKATCHLSLVRRTGHHQPERVLGGLSPQPPARAGQRRLLPFCSPARSDHRSDHQRPPRVPALGRMGRSAGSGGAVESRAQAERGCPHQELRASPKPGRQPARQRCPSPWRWEARRTRESACPGAAVPSLVPPRPLQVRDPATTPPLLPKALVSRGPSDLQTLHLCQGHTNPLPRVRASTARSGAPEPSGRVGGGEAGWDRAGQAPRVRRAPGHTGQTWGSSLAGV